MHTLASSIPPARRNIMRFGERLSREYHRRPAQVVASTAASGPSKCRRFTRSGLLMNGRSRATMSAAPLD